jgi:uncharacterized protein (TIGR00725 family)
MRAGPGRALYIAVCGPGIASAQEGAQAEQVGRLLPGADRTGASPHLTHSLPTGMAEGRNVLVARAADALIAIAGEFGTLSEIAFALKIGVPVVGLGTWELHRRGERVDAFESARTPREAVDAAVRLAANGRARDRSAATPHEGDPPE